MPGSSGRDVEVNVWTYQSAFWVCHAPPLHPDKQPNNNDLVPRRYPGRAPIIAVSAYTHITPLSAGRIKDDIRYDHLKRHRILYSQFKWLSQTSSTSSITVPGFSD
jgi:hypothetical protein